MRRLWNVDVYALSDFGAIKKDCMVLIDTFQPIFEQKWEDSRDLVALRIVPHPDNLANVRYIYETEDKSYEEEISIADEISQAFSAVEKAGDTVYQENYAVRLFFSENFVAFDFGPYALVYSRSGQRPTVVDPEMPEDFAKPVYVHRKSFHWYEWLDKWGKVY